MARMRKHVVFVIDGSKSMDRMDAFDKESGDRIRRVDAVLDCIFEFIQDQLHSQFSSRDDRYSVVSFNDVGKVLLRGKTMRGRDLYQLRRDLEAKIVPKFGTNYGAGLTTAWQVARGGVNDAEEQCVLIFLSDGKPVDMHTNSKKEQFPTTQLRAMRQQFRRRLTFHGVGVGTDDFTLLEDLCHEASGEFHAASLVSLNGRERGRGCKGRNNYTKAPSIPGRAESLEDTFSNISSSVSSMCTMANARIRRGLDLEDIEEAEWNNTHESQFYCDKLALMDGSLSVYGRDVIVRLRHRPFAQGGMRHCFRMWDMGAKGGSAQLVELVGKRSKFVMHVTDELKCLRNDLRCHELARKEATVFNARIRSFAMGPKANHPYYAALRRRPSSIQVAKCEVYRLEDNSEECGFRYLLVEPFLDGKYVKYNGNNGYLGNQRGLDDSQRCWWQVAQAFSHFTYQQSGGQYLICDMQGVDERITDPAVHSRGKSYGVGDRGICGMRDFVESHQCNALCRHLNLSSPEPPSAEHGGTEYALSVTVGGLCSNFGRMTVSNAYTATRRLPAVVYEEDEEEDEEGEEVEYALGGYAF